MIYFVRAGDDGPIKIGTTTQLTIRLAGLKYDPVAEGRDIILLAVMDGGRSVEKSLHRRFSHLRIKGEWHSAADDLLEYIASEGKSVDPDSDELGQVTILAYKANDQVFEEFKAWIEGFAEKMNVSTPVLLDMALNAFAEQRKFKPIPKRLAR